MKTRARSIGIHCLFLLLTFLHDQAKSQTVDSFNPNANNYVYTAIQQPDGKILLAGSFTKISGQSRTNLARFHSDGTLDQTFIAGTDSSVGAAVTCLALQTNGQILVGGQFSQLSGKTRYNIGRLNPDGSLDTTFNTGNFVDGSINNLRIQRDGKILICGSFTQINSQSCTSLCRLNINGSRDTSFNVPANRGITSIALLEDGKILAQGIFSISGPSSGTNLVRLNPDGSFDSSFHTPSFSNWMSNAGGAVAVQADGKILVGGLFTAVDSEAHTNIARLNIDGAVDTAFTWQQRGGSWGFQTFAIQADGRILLGDDTPKLRRLNSDGTLDATFNTNLVSGVMVFCSALQHDGNILVGGNFSKLETETRGYAGRLINTEIATQNLLFDGTNITWLRGGTSPEASYTTFEYAIAGGGWAYLGDGGRISGGWELRNVSIPTNATIRARAFVSSGRYDGSSWYLESIYPRDTPKFVIDDANFGIRSNQFQSFISGSAGSTVIFDSSVNLSDWTPISTNIISGNLLYFSDPSTTNSLQKFYRVRSL